MEPYIYQQEIKVRDYEVDSQRIVNNAIYLHYFELTRHDFIELVGLSFGQLHEMGIDPVVRHVEIDYLTSLTVGETMTSKLWLERVGPRFVFHQAIFHKPSGQPVCRGKVELVCLENGRLTRGDRLAEAFKDYL